MSQRSATLFLFVHLGLWDGAYNLGAWRMPDAPADPVMDIERIKRKVQTAERGKFHGIFIADSLAMWDHGTLASRSRSPECEWYEPFTLCSMLAGCTTNLGLTLTANTTYNEPYHVARKFASLDHLSGGRAGWNVVAGGNPSEARNFSRAEHMDHSLRYERAEEFVEVVTGLWDSWEDDAFRRDKESGIYFDVDKLHQLDHDGRFFAVDGPLTIPRPAQGYPVIAQAGSSPTGLKFATRIAEVIFTIQHDVEKARTFYAEVKEQVAEHGRDPDHVQILPGLTLLVGRTQEEADAKLEQLDRLVDPLVGVERLSFVVDHDLSGYPLDSPVPDVPETEVAGKTLQRAYLDRARADNLTIRQFMHLVSRLGTVPSSPMAAADHIEEWVTSRAADGFNLSFAETASLDLFVEEVVPELQRRGVYHQDYRGSTLRENLGLPRPENRHAQARAAARIGGTAR